MDDYYITDDGLIDFNFEDQDNNPADPEQADWSDIDE